MKKIMTLQTTLMIMFFATAQTGSWGSGTGHSYLPYHQYLQQQYAEWQSSGNNGTRSLVYKQIAYQQNNWDVNKGQFLASDSGLFVYTNQGWATSYTRYNFIQGIWGGFYKLTYNYDGSGNQLSSLNQYWNSDSWENASLLTNTYNSSNQMLTALSQVWDSVSLGWSNVQNSYYAYDSHGNKTQQATQTWNAASNDWINNYQTLYTYDSYNRLVGIVNQQGTVGGNWSNAEQTLNTYDNSNNLLTQTIQTWSGSAWVNSGMTVNTYNANNGLTSALQQAWQNGAWLNVTMINNTFDNNNNQTYQAGLLWNGQTNTWDSTSLNTYTYNAANKILSETDQLNSPAGFVNLNQYIYTYDNNNNNIKYQSFQSVSNTWTPIAVYQYSYDEYGNPVTEEYQSYSLQTGSFQPQNKYNFYYDPFEVASAPSGINSVTRNDFGATIYPNPSSGPTVYVNLTVDADESVVMNVYDLNGRIVNTGFMPLASGSQKIELGSADLASGTYFVQLVERDGSKTSVLPFVKQ